MKRVTRTLWRLRRRLQDVLKKSQGPSPEVLDEIWRMMDASVPSAPPDGTPPPAANLSVTPSPEMTNLPITVSGPTAALSLEQLRATAARLGISNATHLTRSELLTAIDYATRGAGAPARGSMWLK